MFRRNTTRVFAVVIAVTSFTACGSSNNTIDIDLSPEAKVGQQLTVEYGCVACHGSDGEGRVGPAFIDLADSQVTLSDGSVVTADDHYLYKSIVEPDAMHRQGVVGSMPKLNLSEAEILSIIAYIRALKG